MTDRTRTRDDRLVNVKVIVSGLWVSMLFVFAYVDIFGFWRADVLNGVLTGEVPGVGLEINQVFLVLTTLYILIPSLMVLVSLLAPAKINRKVVRNWSSPKTSAMPWIMRAICTCSTLSHYVELPRRQALKYST